MKQMRPAVTKKIYCFKFYNELYGDEKRRLKNFRNLTQINSFMNWTINIEVAGNRFYQMSPISSVFFSKLPKTFEAVWRPLKANDQMKEKMKQFPFYS